MVSLKELSQMIEEVTLYGLRTSIKAILKHIFPEAKISFYGEFIKIQNPYEFKESLRKIEGLYFKK